MKDIMSKKKDICEVCREDLVYAVNLNDYKDLTCQFCGKSFNTNTYCKNGHYICDSCHSNGPIEVIEDFLENTNLKDPFEIADKIMKHPKFKMYGPEHHVLTAAVIITALKNNGIYKPNGEKITLFDIKEAIRRASKIPGGWCGFYGSCGAGMGSGVAISVFTGANPSTDIPRSIANEATTRSLAKIADNLEHCCKRSLKISICETIEILNEKFGIKLPYSPKKCVFSAKNNKCVKENCPFN